MITFGISTWSLHRTLEARAIDLLDVPAQVRAHGLTDLQICHFHLPSRDDDYLEQLRGRIEEHAVTLDALLLDFGDLCHPQQSVSDVREMEQWLTVAAKLGARHARISAGSGTPIEETLARSAQHLRHLSEVGAAIGVRVITENWHAMMPSSREVLRMVELTDGRVPLCLDFGNWSGPGKYAELEAIAPHAVTVHAKCAFSAADAPDAEDFARCLQVLKQAQFHGTVALIYDGPSPDEWRHIDQELALAKAHSSAADAATVATGLPQP